MVLRFYFQAESPSSGRFTALGVYLLTSLFIVVAGFLEFAFILFLKQHHQKQVKNERELLKWKNYWNGKANGNNANEDKILIDPQIIIQSCWANNLEISNDTSERARKIDITFFIFVVFFFLFNVIYFIGLIIG